MRRRFVYLMAVSVCLAMAFTPLMAERAERSADRTKGAPVGVSQDDRTSIHPVVRQVPLQYRSGGDIAATNRASSLMAQAAAAENDSEAISALLQAVSLDPENEKMLAEAYTRLGDLYEGSATKQVQFYGLAMQNTSEPAARAALQNRINSLGGDVFAFAMTPSNNVSSTRDLGPDDLCDGAVPMTLPWYETMSITPAGDHNWRSFDIPGPEGWAVRIETISDNPPYYDDTTLALYGGCDAGIPQGQLYFNDDGGVGFMSLIQTDCMGPGTYYLDVYGFFNISVVLDFHLDVQVTGTCILPEPDGYEPDDTKADASNIGLPSSLPTHANGWGRAKSEIQDHSIYPAFDQDNVAFELNPGAEWVRMGTAFTFPTFFNDFTDEPIGYDADSYIELYYGVEPNYGGFCNDIATGFSPFCKSDEDCPQDPTDPHPAFPPGACIPIYYFTFGGVFYFFPETPLAYNEDIGFGSWGSELVLCLPRSDNNTPSLTADGPWVLRVMSSPVWAPTGTFFYQVQVKNEVGCAFEVEPNNGPFGANPIVLGDTVNGIQEVSEFFGTGAGNDPQGSPWFFTDPDWFAFDTTPGEITLALFATDGFHSYFCDTALVLYVGPDDDGWYYDTGISDDDGGPGYLSEMGVIMPSADELLGNTVADANYFVDVTTWWLNSNFPWTLYTYGEIYVPPAMEVEPNDTCGTANALEVGTDLYSSINPTCDYDSFSFTLAEGRYVVLETVADLGDTTMALWGDGEFLACDDDGSYSLRSLIEGCMPAGDYCAQVRAYSGYSTIDEYAMTMQDLGPCMPTDPPSLIFDGRYRCDGVGYASPEDEFTTCPN